MAKRNDQKIKLLKIYELLKLETDEGHPLTTREICERLGDIGITCDRRTLSKDIDLLNEYDYEIMSVMIGHEKAYYIEDRRFSIPELKILIDAVQAANFITDKKTNELTTKVAALSSSNKAEILKGNTVIFNTRKHSNESIYYNIGYINEAIENKRKVSFNYYDLDEDASKVYRKDKERYVTEPMALVYNHDNYYLMTYSSKYDDIVNYRVDRMDSVEVEEETVSSKAIIQTDNI